MVHSCCDSGTHRTRIVALSLDILGIANVDHVSSMCSSQHFERTTANVSAVATLQLAVQPCVNDEALRLCTDVAYGQ
jgi:hypothetical protein